MIVIILSNCPPSLRGDLTKWFFEVSTNVYVGHVAARVRDNVWDRIERDIGKGRATMIFSADNEQRFDVRVRNAEWDPADLDGIKVMMRPNEKPTGPSNYMSKARVMRNSTAQSRAPNNGYAVLDLSTDAPTPKTGSVVSMRFAVFREGDMVMEGSWNRGDDLSDLRSRLTSIVEGYTVITYRKHIVAPFVSELTGLKIEDSSFVDITRLARERLPELTDFSIESLYRHVCGQDDLPPAHIMIANVYDKLIINYDK